MERASCGGLTVWPRESRVPVFLPVLTMPETLPPKAQGDPSLFLSRSPKRREQRGEIKRAMMDGSRSEPLLLYASRAACLSLRVCASIFLYSFTTAGAGAAAAFLRRSTHTQPFRLSFVDDQTETQYARILRIKMNPFLPF